MDRPAAETGPAAGVRRASEASFRRTLSELAGGVVLVTAAGEDGGPLGLTATSVCSVSLAPPLVLACIGRDSVTGAAVRVSGRFALNFLAAGQEALADRFAMSAPDKFEGVPYRYGALGLPLLDGCLGACECEVERTVEAGDHDVLIGRVVRAEASERPGQAPLVWFRRGYLERGREREG